MKRIIIFCSSWDNYLLLNEIVYFLLGNNSVTKSKSPQSSHWKIVKVLLGCLHIVLLSLTADAKNTHVCPFAVQLELICCKILNDYWHLFPFKIELKNCNLPEQKLFSFARIRLDGHCPVYVFPAEVETLILAKLEDAFFIRRNSTVVQFPVFFLYHQSVTKIKALHSFHFLFKNKMILENEGFLLWNCLKVIASQHYQQSFGRRESIWLDHRR